MKKKMVTTPYIQKKKNCFILSKYIHPCIFLSLELSKYIHPCIFFSLISDISVIFVVIHHIEIIPQLVSHKEESRI